MRPPLTDWRRRARREDKAPVRFTPHRHLLLALVVLIGVGFGGLRTSPPVVAHAELERADPPPDSLLALPPRSIDLWLTEAVDEGTDSPSLRVLDEAGRELTVRNIGVDPDAPTHIRADVVGVAAGTYTIIWSARSSVDGHTLTGSYAFRVGGGGAPGAATLEGETPQPWAVVTRWLTFLGVAMAAGGFLLNLITVVDAHANPPPLPRRRLVAMVVGILVALLATLAEPLLQMRWPPAGTLAPDLTDAVRALPNAWWVRPAALGVLLLVLMTQTAGSRRARTGVSVAVSRAGLLLALSALLGLSLTSHAAARTDWRVLAVASNVLHQWTVALWVGGLVQLGLVWTTTRPSPDILRRFSRLALRLVIIAVGTGVLNAGLVLPVVQALWNSTYGVVLLVKVAALIPPLLLATFHRAALRRAGEQIALVFRRTLRVEGVLVALVVVGGSGLALLAPPGVGSGTVAGRAASVALIAPLIGPDQPRISWSNSR